MADYVKLKAEFRKEGIEYGLSGTDLLAFVEAEMKKVEQEKEKERLEKEKEREHELKKLEAQEKEKEKERLDKEKEREHELKKLAEKEKEEAVKREHEFKLKKLEAEEQEANRKQEFEIKKLELEKSSGNNSDSDQNGGSVSSHQSVPIPPSMSFSLPPFDDKVESVDKYLDRFERTAKEYELDETKWSFKLAQSLRGHAYDVYAKLPLNQVDNFKALKQALLVRYELTADAYRKKFRNTRKDKGETYAQLADRQDTYLRKWIDLSEIDHTFEGLVSLLQVEQLRDSLPAEIKTFAAEQGAGKLAEVVQVADRYAIAHADKKRPFNHSSQSEPMTDSSSSNGHASSTDQQPPNKRPPHPAKHDNQGPKICSYCHKPGHVIAECRHRLRAQQTRHLAGCLQPVSLGDPTSIQPAGAPPVVEEVSVNGQHVKCLYDTGLSFDAIVSRDLVSPESYTLEEVELYGTDQTKPAQTAPVANIDIKSSYVTGTIKAAVMDNPLYSVILGSKYVHVAPPPSHCMNAIHVRQLNLSQPPPFKKARKTPAQPFPQKKRKKKNRRPSSRRKNKTQEGKELHGNSSTPNVTACSYSSPAAGPYQVNPAWQLMNTARPPPVFLPTYSQPVVYLPPPFSLPPTGNICFNASATQFVPQQ